MGELIEEDLRGGGGGGGGYKRYGGEFSEVGWVFAVFSQVVLTTTLNIHGQAC